MGGVKRTGSGAQGSRALGYKTAAPSCRTCTGSRVHADHELQVLHNRLNDRFPALLKRRVAVGRHAQGAHLVAPTAAALQVEVGGGRSEHCTAQTRMQRQCAVLSQKQHAPQHRALAAQRRASRLLQRCPRPIQPRAQQHPPPSPQMTRAAASGRRRLQRPQQQRHPQKHPRLMTWRSRGKSTERAEGVRSGITKKTQKSYTHTIEQHHPLHAN